MDHPNSLILTLFIGLSACGPGTIAWHDGDDVLRTAYVEADPSPVAGWQHVRVLLSNGEFPCAFPLNGDAADQEAVFAELAAAACHEDARHVRLDAWWPAADTAVGHFTGDSRANPGDDGAPLRFASAFYVGIDEAAAFTTSDLVHPYTIVDREYFPDLGVGGAVDVRSADDTRFDGTFAFPEAHISGAFRARTCPAPAAEEYGLFDLLDAWSGDPTLVCGTF